MNILGGIRAIPQTFLDVISESKRSGMRVVLKLDDFRKDPDFFQKTFLAAAAVINLIISQSPAAASLSKLSFVLKTVNMHDAWAVTKVTRRILFENITPRTIDDNAVAESLTTIIENHLYPDGGVARAEHDRIKEEIAKVCLRREFEDFEDTAGCVSYRDRDEFRNVLQNKWVRSVNGLHRISLKDLEVKLLPVSWTAWANDITWMFCDIGCAGLYLQEWNLVDTAKIAERIGGVAKTISLEAGVYFMLSTGFALRFCEAVNKLRSGTWTVAERNQAKWDAITSIFEFTLYGASYLNAVGHLAIKNTSLLWLTVIAKSVGLISIAVKPKHQFFMERTLPKAAAAA